MAPRLAVFGLAGMVVIGVLVFAVLRPDRSSEFDLSQETTYEPCLRAPGGCPCVRDRAGCLERLRDFQEFPVYWLGESFEGLPLSGVFYFDVPGVEITRRDMFVSYGTCLIHEGAEGCALPFTISIYPYCEVPFPVDDVTTSDLRIRGAHVYSEQAGQHVLVWTDGVVILIQSTAFGQADRAVQQLVRSNAGGRTTTQEPLEPPETKTCPSVDIPPTGRAP